MSAAMTPQHQFPCSMKRVLSAAFTAALAFSSAAYAQDSTAARSQQNKELPPATSHEITILEELLPNHIFHMQKQIDKMKERDGMPPPSELSDIRILKLKL